MKHSLQICVALTLAACSNAQETSATDKTQSENKIDQPATPEAAKAPDVGSASSAPVNDSSAKNAAPKASFTSHYTSLGETKCKIVELDDEGAGYVREHCGDFNGVSLYRVEGDLRQSAYAGNQPSGQTTIAPFNLLTDKVEWRMDAGRPVALIYRLKADAPDMPGNGKTQLFVQKIGVGTAPSCIIGLIAGNVPDANVKAHEIADTAAAVTCSDGQTPKIIGDTM